MKSLFRSLLLTLVILATTFSSASANGFKLFGRSKAQTRYSIVEEYKEAYRKPTAMFGKSKWANHKYSKTNRKGRSIW